MLPIVGMSPGNSFFKHKEVAFLLRETIKRYGKTIIMVADEPATSTYQALGYTFSEATRKARLQGNNLKNRTKSVVETMGLETDKIIIVDWNQDVSSSDVYRAEFEKALALYNQNPDFQRSVLSTSEEVLKNSGKDYDKESVERATHYLLSEIAFLEFAPQYFGEEKISYVYHKPWRVYEDYIAGIFDGKVKYYLDFTLLEVPYETFLSIAENRLSRYELIQQRGIIRCGYVPYKAGLFEVDDGKFSGLFYEVMQDVAKTNNLKIEFVEQCGYGVIADRINTGYIDVFCSPVRPTKSRRFDLFFSNSLKQSNVYAYLRNDPKFQNSTLEELQQNKDIRVAVKKNDVHEDIVKEFFPHARIVWLPQLAPVGEEILYVLDNRADIAFWEDVLVKKLLEEHKLSPDLLLEKGWGKEPVQLYDNCIALPWGEFGLKDMLDTSVEKFSSF